MSDAETENSASNEITDVCLLIGRDHIADWKVQAFEQMTEQTGAEVTHIVRAHRPDEDNTTPSAGLFQKVLNPILDPIRSRVAADPKDSTPLSGVQYLSDVDFIETDLISVGTNRFELPSETVTHIAAETDLVIQFGVGILQGDILTAPEHGVLGYHLADVREYRGSYVTLWMFLDRVNRGGVTLQRLTEELDAGEIVLIADADLSDTRSWVDTRRRLYSAAENMLADGINRLQEPDFTPETLSSDELGELYVKSDVTASIKIQYLLQYCVVNYLHRPIANLLHGANRP